MKLGMPGPSWDFIIMVQRSQDIPDSVCWVVVVSILVVSLQHKCSQPMINNMNGIRWQQQINGISLHSCRVAIPFLSPLCIHTGGPPITLAGLGGHKSLASLLDFISYQNLSESANRRSSSWNICIVGRWERWYLCQNALLQALSNDTRNHLASHH